MWTHSVIGSRHSSFEWMYGYGPLFTNGPISKYETQLLTKTVEWANYLYLTTINFSPNLSSILLLFWKRCPRNQLESNPSMLIMHSLLHNMVSYGNLLYFSSLILTDKPYNAAFPINHGYPQFNRAICILAKGMKDWHYQLQLN